MSAPPSALSLWLGKDRQSQQTGQVISLLSPLHGEEGQVPAGALGCGEPAVGGQPEGLSAQGLLCVSSRIYKYQAHGYAFSGVEELLYSLGESAFVNMTQRSVAESLLQVGVTQRFIDDVVSAVLRASYSQSAAMPAFAGEPLALGLPPALPLTHSARKGLGSP